ncbi:hypothetical protein QQG09_00040 [Melissococcus plutonius]|uniref:Uncharacterized protein n=1 Tax=Melissococcus plutonius TaxID=33970 RepID=A0A2Z5Y458_9ENTE|nr:hypothetical protein [Melissococcus plutonius]BAL62685.1 hypothetical protein MPD5_1482 [Melissococcus plutonius DAT561]MCV2498605.1 hypothetical protein [Melissococcus plutonius]MCV2500714.1 hypothetical protein [Melissococcus plutonius]MCV2504728.1 hypothetical protein [Melissococcus plutonius]MCV2507187.1 hypothetical protein [Melissococcus plutonius]
MTTIYIYPKANVGLRGVAIGLDHKGLSLQKFSTTLKNKLENYSHSSCRKDIYVDVCDGSRSPEELLEKEEALVLISPYLKKEVKEMLPRIVVLTEDEFFSVSLDRIYGLIDNL